MHKWKSLLFYGIAVVLVTLAVIFRLTAYRDNNYSIGTNDTTSYLATSQEPLFSWKFLTSTRPFTLPLLYKILRPSGGYVLETISEPALPDSTFEPVFQPGYDRIVLLQTMLSLLGWTALALAVFHRLNDPLLKLLGLGLTLLFAFSPQAADWDRVLQSESLQLSLFALLLALSIELVHCLGGQPDAWSRVTDVIAGAWLIVLVLWQYTRDSNLYAVAVTAVIFLLGLAFIVFRSKRLPGITLIAVGVLLLCSIGLHRTSIQASTRWEAPLIANIGNNVLPYETRVNYFIARGMPYSKLLASKIAYGVRDRQYQTDAAFMQWLYNKGYNTYTQFLIDTPLWAVLSMFNELPGLFAENIQPYFFSFTKLHPNWLIHLADYLHPASADVVGLDVLLMVMLIYISIRRGEQKIVLWTILLFWLLAVEGTLLFVGYHGDFYSKARHAVGPATAFRFTLWLLILVLGDTALHIKKKRAPN